MLFAGSLNALAYFLQLFLILGREDKAAAAWCALALGGVYMFLGGFRGAKREGHTASPLQHLHLALSTVFVTLTVAIRFESQWISMGWFVEAAGLTTIGFWRKSSFVRWQALALIALTIAKVFVYDIWRLERGYRIASFFVLGMLLLAISFVYQRDWLRLSHGSAPGKSARANQVKRRCNSESQNWIVGVSTQQLVNERIARFAANGPGGSNKMPGT